MRLKLNASPGCITAAAGTPWTSNAREKLVCMPENATGADPGTEEGQSKNKIQMQIPPPLAGLDRKMW